MSNSGTVRARLLGLLAAVATAGALKLTQPVTLPLAAALFLIVLSWPVRVRVERTLPRGVAYWVTLLTVLIGLAAFLGAIAWSLGVVLERGPEIVERAEELRDRVRSWGTESGLSDGGEGEGAGGPAAGAEAALPVILSVWSAGTILFLTIAFYALALGEVRSFGRKLEESWGSAPVEGIRDIATKVRGFTLALTLAGLLGGAASLGYGLALGLEHALVWAFLAYLLNYVPVVGSTIAVFPPTLWALVQFDGLGRPAAVLAGFGLIQFVVGNYVAPRFESRYARISPLVVLFSIMLWGWIWGPLGALLGVPLTVAVLTAAQHFEGTRRLAALLSVEEE